MKTLLVGINASYTHTCLAVRSIWTFVGKQDCNFVEFTINEPVGQILRGIVQQQPDLVLFATYIWNAQMACVLVPEVKRLLPHCLVGAGGPEFGFAPQLYLEKLPSLDFVVCGEGEQTVFNVIQRLEDAENAVEHGDCDAGDADAGDCDVSVAGDADAGGQSCKNQKLQILAEFPGLFVRGYQAQFKPAELLCDLSLLKFPYPEFENHKIFYYESSRGCPFSCSYCLSSVDKRVRFMPLERVFADLQKFLDAQVPLVKFVDRTFNLQPERYIAIWRYIVEHHNGVTMFHFEIEAEGLNEAALDFLQTVPAGVMQFEIGLQSANKQTLQAINRSDNVELLAAKVRRIPRTIHQHLDLIAGLPFEDLASFGRSVDFVMALRPDALQLGFLKILHGTQMETYASQNGWKWIENPVYETLETPYLPYKDMLFLKDVEVLVDAYWNSGVFSHSMAFLGQTMGFWHFFEQMVLFGRGRGVFEAQRRETFWFELMADFSKEVVISGGQSRGSASASSDNVILLELLRYDFVLRGKQGGWPKWYEHRLNKERYRALLEKNGALENPRIVYAHSEYETFLCNVDEPLPKLLPPGQIYEKIIKY